VLFCVSHSALQTAKTSKNLLYAQDVVLIKTAHKRFHGKTEIRTIKMYLEFKKDTMINIKRIARIKKAYGTETKIRRKNNYYTFIKAVQESITTPNFLKRKLNRNISDGSIQ